MGRLFKSLIVIALLLVGSTLGINSYANAMENGSDVYIIQSKNSVHVIVNPALSFSVENEGVEVIIKETDGTVIKQYTEYALSFEVQDAGLTGQHQLEIISGGEVYKEHVFF